MVQFALTAALIEPMKAKLTPRTVNAAKPASAPFEIHDTDLKGLLLRVQPSGVKSYVVTWGRGKRKTLGRHPVMTIAGARSAALASLSEATQHGAPLAVIEAQRSVSAKPLTLGTFIRENFAPWALTHQKAGQATLDGLQACFGYLYDKLLADVCAFDIERFKSQRLKAGLKPATVNRDLDRIRGALSRAVDWGLLESHPLKTVKRAKGADNTRVRYLAKDEEKRLRAALAKREDQRRTHRVSGNAWNEQRGFEPRPMWRKDGFTDHLMPMVLVALNTGLRRGELFGLKWTDVNLPGKLLTVTAHNAKSRKARHLPLNMEAHDALTRWKKQAGGELVFPGAGGGRLTNVNKSWDGLVTEAGLVDFRFHDLRHDFASKLVMAGVDLNTVRELLGHSDLKMTLRYAHLAPDRLSDVVSLLDKRRVTA